MAVSVPAIQTAARWLTGAFAAVGAAVVAGVQLNTLDRSVLPLPALVVAASAYAVAVLAVIVAITATSRVLVVRFDSLGDLASLELDRRQKAARRNITLEHQDELFRVIRTRSANLFRAGFGEYPLELETAQGRLDDALVVKSYPVTVNGRCYEAEQDLLGDLRQLQDDCNRLVAFANVWETTRRYRRMRTVTVLCGLAVALAVPLFVLAAQPVQTPGVVVDGIVPVTVHFEQDRPEGHANCDRPSLPGVIVAGSLETPTVVLDDGGTNCPPVVFSTADSDAVAVPMASS